MFCPKCGMKAVDGGVFCLKCGARLAVEKTEQPAAGTASVRQEYPQVQDVSVGMPKKKKSRKYLIILGVVVLAAVAIAAIAGMWDVLADYENSSETQGKIDLSETYINEEEGISFQYPSAWVPVSEEEFEEIDGTLENGCLLVMLANVTEDLPENTAYIGVSKYTAVQEDIDYIFMDDEQFINSIDSEVSVKDTIITKLDGIPARKFTYFTPDDGLGSESWFYAVGSVVYRIDFSWIGESPGNNQRFFDAVIDSYKITAAETAAGKNDSAAAGKLTDADKLLYNGIPVDTIMEMKAEDVIAAFGEADEYSDENFIQILSEDGERLVAMVNFDSAGYVSYFAGDPEKYELDGQNLNHDYDELVETFGREPDSQEMFDLLEIKWFYDGYSILIGLDNGRPGKAEVRKKNTVEETEKLIYDWIEDGHQMEDGCYPEYVGEGRMDDTGAEVYNFHLMASRNAWIPVSVEKDTGMMWAVPDNESIMSLDEYYNDYYGGSDAAANSLPNGFIWVEKPTGKTDNWATTITGIIQNTSDQTYDYVDISFNLYDSSGNQIGTAIAYIGNLKSGGTWKFEAIGEGNAPRFEFSSIDYH